MTFEEVFVQFVPKPEYTILKGIGETSGKFLAFIYKKVTVQVKLGRKETAEISIATIAATTVEDYITQLKPYINHRDAHQ